MLLAILMLFTLLLILSAFNLGIRAFVVSSGSMSPALRTGDLVFVRESSKYQKGDIITFIDSRNEYISHRIVKVEKKEGKTSFVTKGDANNSRDGSPVSPVNVMGRVSFSVPLIGIPIAFFHTRIGLSILIVSIGALLIWLILAGGRSTDKRA